MSDLTAAMAAEANADHNNPLTFVRIDFPYPEDTLLGVTAPFNITLTGTGDSDLDGETFVPLDALVISDFQQDVSGAIQEMSLSLDAADATAFIEILDDDNWWASPAKVWFGYFDTSDFTTVILSPSQRFSGFLDRLPLTVDDEISHITAVLRSNRMLFERNRGNRYVAAQHQERYPTDRSLSFLPRLVSGELLLANDKPMDPLRGNSDDAERRGYGNFGE